MQPKSYILAIDQSTSGTKALLFDEKAQLVGRCDKPHKQIVNENNWVEHDPIEIYNNVLWVVRQVIEKTKIDPNLILAAGISNQRETGVMWQRCGTPIYNAIVWQCARGKDICHSLEEKGKPIKQKTGLNLSPFFTAAKFSWLMQNVKEAKNLAEQGNLLCGTMDSFLLYRLTGTHKTDFSNASRTQLFNINTLEWDNELCQWFGVPKSILPTVCFSDSLFGESTFEGIFEKPIPIHGILGDSHGALFAQGCTNAGMAKVTYGTGCSIMMNTGNTFVYNEAVVSSLAWGIGGHVQYVLEGNINDCGTVLNWLVDDLQLLSSPKQAQELAKEVAGNDGVYFVPAFSGLGAPHWESQAKAMFCGITRNTKKAHLARAAEECIAYQVKDIIEEMNTTSISLTQLRADGGPTKDSFLMQFQADMLQMPLLISKTEELSGAGAAYVAGISVGLYTNEILMQSRESFTYQPHMNVETVAHNYEGWKKAVNACINV